MKPLAEITNCLSVPMPIPIPNCDRTPEKSKPCYRPNENMVKSLAQTERIIKYKLSSNQAQMREHLFKWAIAKCQLILELRVSTIEHCMALFDYFIDKQGCFVRSLDEGQLVILACLFISSKYQEIYPPSITDFEFVLKYKFSAREIIQKEFQILAKVQFKLNFALVSDWVYGLSGKNMPELVLHCIPRLSPEYPYKKLAQIVVQSSFEFEKAQQFEVFTQDEIMAQVQRILKNY